MAGEENGTGPSPVFDFSQVNRVWAKRWMRKMNRASELQLELFELQKQEMNETTSRRILQLTIEMEEIGTEQEQLVAQVLVDVPREWLSNDAPKKLDWAKPESLDWLLESEYPTLIQAMQMARQQTSKN